VSGNEASAVRNVKGTALPLRGNDVDTDRIIPARFLRAVTFEGLEHHVFEDDRASDEAHPFSKPAYAGASVLLVNANFGCGSSREHAPQALQRWGIRAVVGESFSEIFFGNSLAMGLPCLKAEPAAMLSLMQLAEGAPETVFEIDVEPLQLRAGGQTVTLTLSPGAHAALVNGTWDATGLLLERYAEVEAVARRLPYLSGFGS